MGRQQLSSQFVIEYLKLKPKEEKLVVMTYNIKKTILHMVYDLNILKAKLKT